MKAEDGGKASMLNNPFSGLYHRIIQRIHPKVSPNPPQPSGLDQLQAQLQLLLANAWSRKESEALSPDRPEVHKRRSQEEGWREERRIARAHLLEAILQRHQSFATGFARSQLERLGLVLKAHEPRAFSPATLEQTMQFHILGHLYAQSGPPAWAKLVQLLEEKSLDWPVSPDLLESYRSDDRTAVLAQCTRTLEMTFLARSPSYTADYMMGEIPVWTYLYPMQGGWLWEQTVLEAVACAFRAHLFAFTVNRWIWRDPHLEEQLTALLEPYLARSRTLVADVDLSSSATILEDLQHLFVEVIPRIVWDYASAGHCWGAEASEDPGFVAWDPVCGMGLKSSHLQLSFTWEEHTHYFCCKGCLEQFQAAPESFFRNWGGGSGQ